MRRELTVRAALRAATAEAHERVDRVFSAFDLGMRDGYARFLQAQAAALLPLERALDAGAGPALGPAFGIDWPPRRRGAALMADLAALDRAEPEDEALAPIERPAAALGTLYVLEGSRLGGTLLRRSVPADLPAAFLAPAPAGAWRALLEALEAALPSAALQEEAVAAAGETFRRFERCGRRYAQGIAR